MIEYKDVLALLLAVGIGALIGAEREKAHMPAGLRTHMLVCMSAALLTLAAVSSYGIESSRVVQGIITGIGFLGAGSIIAFGRRVRGLTTAATVWMTAILGTVIGLGDYFLATAAGILTVMILKIKPFEKKL